jgi:hypothetical protein
MVCRTVGTGDPASCIEQIDVGTTALLPAALALPEGAPGTAAILVDRPGRITVLTQAESRQFLVLSESYHSGWRATVDGQPTPVIAAYGDFMGCVVESGEHRVQWLFRPRSVIVGAWISLAGIAGLLVQCGIVWLRPRRAQVHPPPATG